MNVILIGLCVGLLLGFCLGLMVVYSCARVSGMSARRDEKFYELKELNEMV